MANETVTSHWQHIVENFQYSSQQFYDSVEKAVKKWKLPDCEISHVFLSEGGLFSSSREYLRVERKNFHYDICAAPFGTGFFVSSWGVAKESGFLVWLASIPFVGWIFAFLFLRFAKPMTYYKMDTDGMFQSAVHSAVIDVFDDLTKAKGIKALSETDRKPVMKEFFAR